MDAFRALPANDDGSVAVANAADTALLEHGICAGFSWLCTAAGQAFRTALVGHGAQGGFADTTWRWLLLGTDADRPPGQATGRGDRAQGWFATLFANMTVVDGREKSYANLFELIDTRQTLRCIRCIHRRRGDRSRR